MSWARAIRRGRCLKPRLGVNGIQKGSRSFGTAAVATFVFVAMGPPRNWIILAYPFSAIVTKPELAATTPSLSRATRSKPPMADPKSGKKPQKLKARLPRRLAARAPRPPGERPPPRHMVEAIRVVFERYGFEPVDTPAIEYTDALGKFLPDEDRPNDGAFSFQEEDEQALWRRC